MPGIQPPLRSFFGLVRVADHGNTSFNRFLTPVDELCAAFLTAPNRTFEDKTYITVMRRSRELFDLERRY
jgi:hypothetical protein